MSQLVLLLRGYKGSGKTTLADKIFEFYKDDCWVISYADTLRDSANYLFGDIDFTSPDKKEEPLHQIYKGTDNYTLALAEMQKKDLYFGQAHTPRSLLLLLGAVCRFYNPNYFIDSLHQKIKEASEYSFKPKIIIVPDLRLKVEEEMSKSELGKLGYKVIRVDILREPPKSEHMTERDLDGTVPDYVVDNTGELSSSVAQLINIIENNL